MRALLRVRPLDEGEHAGGDRGEQENADSYEQTFEATVRPPLARQLALALGPALGQERALELVQLRWRPAAQSSVADSRAPVELSKISAGFLPALRTLCQVLTELPALASSVSHS